MRKIFVHKTMEVTFKFMLLSLTILIFSINICKGQFVNINTTLGVIRGVANSDVSVFTAIPYGEPPVGNLRFQKPQKVAPWQDVYDATKEGNTCIQFLDDDTLPAHVAQALASKTESEDCLNLDIYVPHDLSTNSSGNETLLPVLFFIHGGDFIQGSRLDYNGTLLSKRGDMIVVIINYRLGALGFLVQEHDETPGNIGLMDQILALEWVRDNIEAFRGDPSRVTIYSERDGSFGINLLVLSPAAKDLFHGAIIGSGMYYNTLRTKAEVANVTDISKELGCNISTSATILTCLRDLNTTALKGAFNKERFRPYIDGLVIPERPSDIISSGKFNRVPIMAGFNSEDGSALMIPYGPDVMFSGLFEDMVDDFINETLVYTLPGISPEKREVAHTLAKTYYFSYTSDPLTNLRSALDFGRDIYWSAPAVKLARWFSKEVPVYLYEFDERYLSNPGGSAAIPVGAAHGDDLSFIFGSIEDPIAFPLDYTFEKLQFVKDLMATWSDFVHNGKPSLRTVQGQSLEWKAYTEDNPTYAILKVDVTTTKVNPARLADMVWNKMLGPVKTPLKCPAEISSDPHHPIVITESGQIKGMRHTNNDSGMVWETFFGIPYAAPPVHDLRFRKTHPVKPWTGIHDATKFGNICPQNKATPGDVSEDCLNLNIWVPGGVNKSKKSPLPILVYIHGGAYVSGHNRLDMTGFATHGNVIVVSVQYRLGILGFMSTGNNTAPGNLALWDLLQALEWVRANGGYFGGDISKITVGGQSAGGALSTMLMLSPRVHGYFNNVFAMSGSGIGSWSIDRYPGLRFNHLAKKVGCSSKNTDAQKVECLRELPLEKLVEAMKDLLLEKWMPNVDGVMLPDTPYQLRLQPYIKEFNFLGGTIKTEGEGTAGRPPPGMSYKDYLIMGLNLLYPYSPSVAPAVVEFYNFNGTDDARKFHEFVRDEWFLYGIESLAQAMTSHGSKAYVYVASFDHPEKPDGPLHGDELPLFAGIPLMNNPNSTFTPEHVKISNNFVTYFSNFVTTGNPNEDKTVPVEWPVYDLQTRSHIMIHDDMSAFSMQYFQRQRYVDFFNNVVPILVNKGNRCITSANIVQESYSPASEKNKTILSCANQRSGAFFATKDELDAAVIALIVVSAFLLLLVFVLSMALCKRSSSSSPKKYEFRHGRSNSAISF